MRTAPSTLVALASLSVLLPLSAWGMRGPDGKDPSDRHVVPSTGEARLRIDIEAPKGTGGSEPQLTLLYSSAGADGPFGFGWRLPLGEIRRTTRFGTPAYNSTDRFEFEGQLLVPDNEASPTEYRTITETFARIEPVGESWEVTFPDGRMARFGTNENSRVRETVSGGIFRWLLSELEDPSGNITVFTYERSDPGTAYPLEISYSYRDQGGFLGLVGVERKVEFVYENRPDPILHFGGGVETHLTRRVAEIQSVAGSEPFRRMVLSYNVESDPYPAYRSRLASVQIYGTDCPDGEALSNCQAQPPRTFAYTQPNNEIGADDHWDLNQSDPDALPPIAFVEGGSDAGVRLGDVNGDGRLDLVRAWIKPDTQAPFEETEQDVWLHNGKGWSFDQAWTNALRAIDPGAVNPAFALNGAFVCGPNNTQSSNDKIAFSFTKEPWRYRTPQDAQLVDVNADGRADIVLSMEIGAGKADGDKCAAAEWSGTPVRGVWINNGSNSAPSWDYDAQLSNTLPIFTSTFVRTQSGGNTLEGGAYQNAAGGCGGDEVQIYQNLFTSNENHSSVFYRESHGVRFADLNGDQRPDLIASREDAHGRSFTPGAWINTENGWQPAPEYTPPVPLVGTFSYFAEPAGGEPYANWVTGASTGVQVVDVNGDGLADLVKTAVVPVTDPNGNIAHGPLSDAFTTSGVWLNTGSGWCSSDGACPEAIKYLPPSGYTFTRITMAKSLCFPNNPNDGFNNLHQVVDTGLFYADLNGDGLLDLVQNETDDKDGAGQHAWLQSPGRSGSIWLADDRFRPPEFLEAYWWVDGNSRIWNGVQLRDVDGNGTGDWLKSFDTARVKRLSVAGHGDRMEKFANGQGGTIEFQYRGAIEQMDVDDAPAYEDSREEDAAAHAASVGEDLVPGSGPITLWRASPVISEVTVNSLDGSYTTTFAYGHPRWCPAHRSSLGFRVVESELDDQARVTSLFWQDHGRAGRMSRRNTYDGVNLVEEVTNDWEVVDGANVGASLAGVFVGRLTLESRRFRYLNNKGATRTVTYDHDDTHGFNFVKQIDVARPTGSLHVARTPHAEAGVWIGQNAKTEAVTSSTGKVLRSREFVYVPGRGLLKRVKDSVQPRTVPQAGDPPPELAITEWVYDQYGNPTQRTDAEGRDTYFCWDGDTALGSAHSCPSRATASHSVLAAVLDPAQGLSEVESDLASGRAEVLIRFNGDRSWIEPDAFGRPIEFWTQPVSHAGGTLLEERFYVDDPAEDHPNTPGEVAGRPYVERFEEVGNGTAAFSATYFDGFGREAWTAFRTPIAGPDRFGRALFRDHAGRLVRQTYEIVCDDLHCTNLASENSAGASGSAAVATYDALGRLVTLETPDGMLVVARSRVNRQQPAGPGTTDDFDVELVQQPDGVLTRRILDGNRVVWVEECANKMVPPRTNPGSLFCNTFPAPDTTFYTYEATGEVDAIFDAVATSTGSFADPAHQLVYSYDTLGRLIEINDPDGGTSATSYDLVGNVLSATNARGQTRSFAYDVLDRVTQIDEPWLTYPFVIKYDPVTRNVERATTYSYFGPTTFEYDDFGRLSRKKRGLLFIDLEYDLLGRTTRVTYPSTDTAATYEYNGNYLQRVCDSADLQDCVDGDATWFVSEAVYDELGRLKRIVQPPGTLEFEFDPDTYGLEAQTLTDNLQTDLINLAYEYDQARNIKEITDGHTTIGADGLDAGGTYTYDQRGRLKTATVMGSPPRVFDYDELGNLIQRDAASQNQFYDGSRPHAIVRRELGTQTLAYAYDADGNMTQRGDQYLSYDSANALRCVGSSSGGCDILKRNLDYDGSIITLQAPGGDRRFLGDYFMLEVTGNVAHSSIYAFGQRIAVVTQEDAALRSAWAPVPGRFPLDPERIGSGVATVLVVVLLALAGRAGVCGAILVRPRRAGIAMIVVFTLLPHPAWAGGYGGTGDGSRVLRFYYQDHLGTDIVIATADGTLVSRRVYEPFGRLEDESLPTESSRHRFTGQRMEASTGLYDFHARQYDPESGRFLSVDPIVQRLADPQTHNAYGYVRNNPVNLTDPNGTCFIGVDCLFTLGAIISFVAQAAATASILTSEAGGFGTAVPPTPGTGTSSTSPLSNAEPTTAEGPSGEGGGGGGGGNGGPEFRRVLVDLSKSLASSEEEAEETLAERIERILTENIEQIDEAIERLRERNAALEEEKERFRRIIERNLEELDNPSGSAERGAGNAARRRYEAPGEHQGGLITQNNMSEGAIRNVEGRIRRNEARIRRAEASRQEFVEKREFYRGYFLR